MKEKKTIKISRDPYYSDLFDKYGFKFIEDAGYFEDSVNENSNIFDYDFHLSIPVHSISKDIYESNNPAVIITTGSFCPVHDGHIEMMQVAKKAVENKGYQVLAGYISPDHDDYIIEKNGDEAILAYERIQLINDKCKNIDWLNADPSGSIFSKGSINFTEVVNNLEKYLSNLFEKEITIFYVCGGDNARFAKTFVLKGNCVVVNRPGYETKIHQLKHYLSKCKNIIWAENKNELSSTLIRKISSHNKAQKKNLNIRIHNNKKDENSIINILKNRYNNIEITKITEQKVIFDNLNKSNNLISLDSVLYNNDKTLKTSRHYDLFGSRFIEYGNRPGSLNLEQQAELIPKDNYILIDDDIHTGGTMRFAKNILESKGHTIDAIMSLSMSVKGEEILDVRDLIVGGDNNGLVVKLPNGKISRAPYIYPFVCPFQRASILDPIEFSIEIWQQNYDNYKDTSYLLKHNKGVYELFKLIGFKDDTHMSEICEYYIKSLKSLKNG